VALTRGGSAQIEATQPGQPITPIQIRRCRWILHRGPRVFGSMSCGYLIIVSPGRRYWRFRRRGAVSLSRRIRSLTIES
jgi:hypothetical protein